MNKLTKAIVFAAKAHEGQQRKLGKSPYITHPFEVMSIVARMTEDEDILCAAVLHDVIEDTSCTEDDVKKDFGERVLRLVLSETEEKRKDLPPDATWKQRKTETLEGLKKSDDIAVKMLWLADKLSNLRSIYSEWKKIGDEAFNAFNQKDKSEHAWYYSQVAKFVKDGLSGTDAYKEYEMLIDRLFG